MHPAVLVAHHTQWAIDPVTLWIFCLVVAKYLQNWWLGAAAQARSELRRARQNFANTRVGWGRQLRGKMDAGWQAGPGASGWWWPAVAWRAWRGLRGLRPGTTGPAALPHASPWRRILAAGWAHARRGAAEIRNRPRTEIPSVIDALALGILALGAGMAALVGRRPRRRTRTRLRLAACDNCRAIVNEGALQPVPREVDGHTEIWQLCPVCAAAARQDVDGEGEAVDPPPELDPAPQPEHPDLDPDPVPVWTPQLRPLEPGQPVWTTAEGLAEMLTQAPATVRILSGGRWREITGWAWDDGTLNVGLDGEPGNWQPIGPMDTVHALPPGADPAAAGIPGRYGQAEELRRRGWQVTGVQLSPDFDAFTAGKLDASQVRCVGCGAAPCQCRFCDAPYQPWDQDLQPCGMRVPAGEVECPRGHSRQPVLLTVRSVTGRELTPDGADHVTLMVWSRRDLDRRLAGIAEDPDLQAFIRPAELPPGTEDQEDQEPKPGGDTDTMAGTDIDTGSAGTGEAYTHGQWVQATEALHRALRQLPLALDHMLGSLTTVDAGRTQFTGVMDLNDQAQAWAEQVHAMLGDVNTRELPVVDAVSTAGGPGDVNNMDYYKEV